MAQVIDELGRVVEGQKTANLTLDEIKKLVATSVQSGVGKATPFNKETSKPATEKLVSLFERYTKEFNDAIKEQKDYLKEMSQTLKEIADKKEENKGKEKVAPKKDKDAPKPSVWKNLESLAKKGLQKHSIGVHDTHCEKVLNEIKGVLEQMRDGGGPKPPKPPKPPIPPSPKPPEDGGGGGDPFDPEEEAKKEKKRQMTQLSITRIRETALKNILGVIQDQILGFDVMSSVLDGVLDKERQFVQEARKISYEIEGATQDQTKLMRQFENIDKTVSQTGKTRQEFIERYRVLVRMGIKDLKKVRAITIAQLNTEEQLGMKAGELGDTFVEWSQGLQMSEGQIAEMGRGMRDVARFTGLSGDALKGVVESSKTYIDNLKTAGTSTAATLKNIIELQANFKKVGVDGGKLMDAMTSTNKLLTTSSSTFALLAKAAQQAGVYGKLFSGTLLQSKTSMKAMGKQFASIANQFGIAGSSAEELRASFANMSDEMKARVNIQLKAAFDIEAGELLGTVETFEASSKTLADKLGDVNKKLKANLTLEEKAGVLEEQRKLKLSASMGALTALDEAAKSTKSMGDALAKFGQRRGEFEGDMAALGQAWTSEADVARGAIQSAMDSVNKGLKAAGKQELSIDSSTIEQALKDPTAFRELTAKITKAEQEASTAAKAQLDPLSSAAQTLKEINDTLRNLANAGFSSIFNSAFGQVIVWLAVIAGAALGIWKIYNEISQIGEFIKQAIDPAKYAHEMDALWGADVRSLGKLGEKGSDPGSIYTHDIHLEKILQQIKDCICSQTQASANAAPKAAAAQTESKPTATEKSIRRHQEKQMKQEKWENKQKAKNIKMETKNTLGEKKLISKDMKTQAAPTGDFDSGILSSMGGDMAKNAAAIGILAAGVMALGAAIIFLGKKILDFLGLDMATVMQTAGTVAAVVTAGGAIAVAAIGVYKLLETKETKEFIEGAKTSYTDVLKMAGAILLIGPGLVILGAAIVWMCKKVIDAFGLDLTTVAETAGSIAAIAMAAGAIAGGVVLAMDALNDMSENPLMKNPTELVKNIAIGAIAMLILGPAIVGLASAIIWISSKILGLFGMDAGTAAKIGMDVAAVIGAAAVIIGGVILASAALALLGWALMDGGVFIATAALLATLGAIAITLLTPPILLLGLAVIKMAQGLMAITGIDMGTAAKVAGDVAGVIGSAALIAGAVLGATLALAILGASIVAILLMSVLAFAGARALVVLTPAIILLSAAIIGMADGIASLTGLNAGTAKVIAENVSGIIGAAASIAWSVLSAGASLAILGIMATSPLIFAAAAYAIVGARALFILTPAMIALSAAVIGMAKGVMSAIGISPAMGKEIAEGLSGILKAASDIASAVIWSATKLSVLGLLLGTTLWAVPLMLMGTTALMILSLPLITYIGAVMGIARKLGSMAPPNKMIEMSEGVANILKAVGETTEKLMSAKDKIIAFKENNGIFKTLFSTVPTMYLAAATFWMMGSPIAAFCGAVISVAKKLPNPKIMADMSNGVTSILQSIGQTAENLMATKDKIIAFRNANGIFKTLLHTVPSLYLATIALLLLKKPVLSYADAIIGFAGEISKKLSPSDAKKYVKTLYALGIIMEQTSRIMNFLVQKMVPLTESGWFTASPAKKIGRARPIIATLFDSISSLVRIIVDKVKDKFSDFKELKSAAKSLLFMAVILKYSLPAIQIMTSSIVPLTTGGWFVKSPVKKIKAAIPQFAGFFEGVAKFVGTIVKSTSGMSDVKQLRSAAITMLATAQMLKSTSIAISALSAIVGMMEPGWFFSKTPIEKIKKYKNQFGIFFQSITDFVKIGIIDKIKTLPPGQELMQAACIMFSLARVLFSTKVAIESLSATLKLMEGGFFTKSPIAKIIKNKDEFAKHFQAIALFVNEGIVKPVIAEFKDYKQIISAARIIYAMAIIAKSIVPVIQNLSAAMSLMSGGFWSKSPISKILDNRDEFQAAFTAIGKFMHDGIVKPVIAEFGDPKQIQAAGRIVSAMAMIAKGIVPTITNMATAVGLLDGRTIFSDSPIEKILDNKNEFQRAFTAIGKFMHDGIVKPVIAEFGDPKQIQAAARIIQAMTIAVAAIPKVINGMAYGLMPLIDSGMSLKETPAEKIEGNTDKFGKWFTSIAKFMMDGIVIPILTELPEPKIILMAARILSAMALIIGRLPIIIGTMAQLFAPLCSGSFIKDSPISLLASGLESYKGWFRSITSFLREGIIWPIIDSMPTSEEVEEADMKLIGMKSIIAKAIKAFSSFSESISPLITGWWWFSPIAAIGSKAARFTGYWDGISNMLNAGIIEPIKKNLPPSKEIEEAATRINALADVLLGVKTALELLSKVMMDIQSMNLDMNALKTLPLTQLMAIGSGGKMIEANSAAGKGSAIPSTESTARQQIIRSAMERGTVRPAMESGMILPQISQQTGSLTNPTVISHTRPTIKKGMEINPYTIRRDRNAARRSTSRGAEIQSIESAHQRIAEENRRASASTGVETTPVVPQKGRTIPPTIDMHSEVRQNAAGREPSTSQVTSPELAQIVNASNEEVDQQKQMVSLLEEMLKLFKGGSSKAGGSSGSGGADTSSNTIGQKPTNYYRWPSGKHFQTAGQQILNIGSQTV